MSGHSKWHSIKHKKGAVDAKRGSVFTKHAKLIAVAARSGGDPDMNPSLRLAIDNAKADNVPNANIERAIKKGTGEDKDGSDIIEAMYEGYGPEGIALYIQVVTDNRNRTVQNVKHALSKNGGNLAESGSVRWMFERKGFFWVDAGEKDPEEVMLELIDTGALDVNVDGTRVEVYTDPSQLHAVKKAAESLGYTAKEANITYDPKEPMKVDDPSKAKRILRFMETLEEDEDVTNVFSNFDIEESLME